MHLDISRRVSASSGLKLNLAFLNPPGKADAKLKEMQWKEKSMQMTAPGMVLIRSDPMMVLAAVTSFHGCFRNLPGQNMLVS